MPRRGRRRCGESESQTDAELIARSVNEAACFDHIYTRHSDDVYLYVVRRVAPCDVESLVGDVFGTAFLNREQYDLSRPLAIPWLYGIAYNVIRDHFRARLRQERVAGRRELAVEFAEENHPDTDRAGDAQRLRVVRAGLETLEEQDRETLLLYAWDGLSYGEIAETMGVPIGTVRSRISRARRELKSWCSGREEATG